MSKKNFRFDSIRDFRQAAAEKDNKKAAEFAERLTKQFVSEVKILDEEKRHIGFVISTDSIDRMGDTIDPDGWDLKNYKKNPVVLFAHDSRQPPVAKSISIKIEDGKLKSVAEFAPKDMYPFADMIFQMYMKGFMRATSVGFRPLKWAFVDNDDRPWGIDFMEQELLEYSCVPVPANPEALVDAKAKGIDLNPLKAWADDVLDAWDEHKGLSLPRKYIEKLRAEADQKKKSSVVVPPETQDELLRKNLENLRAKKEQEEAEAAAAEATTEETVEEKTNDTATTLATNDETVIVGDIEVETGSTTSKSEETESAEATEETAAEAETEEEAELEVDEADAAEEESASEEEEPAEEEPDEGDKSFDLEENCKGFEEILALYVDTLEGKSFKDYVATRRGARTIKNLKGLLKELYDMLNEQDVKKDVPLDQPVTAPPATAEEKTLDEQESVLVIEEEDSPAHEEKADSEVEFDLDVLVETIREVVKESVSAEAIQEEVSKVIGKLNGRLS